MSSAAPGPASARAGLRVQQLALAAAIQGGNLPAGLLSLGPPGQAASLAVYAQAYSGRLQAALRDNLTVLARALGDEGFAALAQAYLLAHPSTEPSIRWFGHRLAGFMDAAWARDDGLVPHPAFADLARMDWALRAAFDAADATPMGADTLAALAPDDWPVLRLGLHPSVQLCPLQWAVEAAWRLLNAAPDGEEPELPAPEAQPHTLLVWRMGLATRWRSLGPLEATLLAAAQAGLPFAGLCTLAADALGGDDQAAPARVVGLLQQWLAEGLLVSAAA